MKAFTDMWYKHWTHIPQNFPTDPLPQAGKIRKQLGRYRKQEANYSLQGWNLQILEFLFFFGWVAFPEQPSVSHCSRANKAAAEGDSLLQWSWLHTLSNLHNLPHNLNQLKRTPGDYIQKPIWKNIHCLSLKKSRGKEAEWPRLQLMKRKKQKKSNRNKDLVFTFVSIFSRISLW